MNTGKETICPPTPQKAQKGFTLVELSIVIVIIGLIVAGVVAGQSLVLHGKILSQLSDLKKYETGFNTFATQYNAIPGDLSNAGSYWSGTPNGDGNGYLNNNGDTFSADTEGLLLFEHLSKAELIEGNYDASSVATAFPLLKIDPKKGINAGSSTIDSAGAGSCQLSASSATERHKASLYLEVATLAFVGTANDWIGVASPRTMQLIDEKIDDGIARKGRFRAFRPWGSTQGNCLTGADGNYLLTNSLPGCHGEYILK